MDRFTKCRSWLRVAYCRYALILNTLTYLSSQSSAILPSPNLKCVSVNSMYFITNATWSSIKLEKNVYNLQQKNVYCYNTFIMNQKKYISTCPSQKWLMWQPHTYITRQLQRAEACCPSQILGSGNVHSKCVLFVVSFWYYFLQDLFKGTLKTVWNAMV